MVPSIFALDGSEELQLIKSKRANGLGRTVRPLARSDSTRASLRRVATWVGRLRSPPQDLLPPAVARRCGARPSLSVPGAIPAPSRALLRKDSSWGRASPLTKFRTKIPPVHLTLCHIAATENLSEVHPKRESQLSSPA